MRLEDVPVVGGLLAAGADDRVFDALLVLGPVVILAIAVLGRGPVSLGLAGVYVAAFTAYVGYKGLTATSEKRT